jgi:hypothetical protein
MQDKNSPKTHEKAVGKGGQGVGRKLEREDIDAARGSVRKPPRGSKYHRLQRIV